jgi:hypothetical protein
MKKPLMKFRASHGVSAAIWENNAEVNGRSVTMLKATVERRYKDSNGDWKSSGSFGRNELPMAILVMCQAFSKIVSQEQESDSVPVEDVR